MCPLVDSKKESELMIRWLHPDDYRTGSNLEYRALDTLFDDLLKTTRNFVPDKALLCDIFEKDDSLYIVADIPAGSDKPEVKIEKGVLSITVNRPSVPTKGYSRAERVFGKWTRQFDLDEDTVDADSVDAEVKDGVLTITFKKSSKSRTKVVEVR